MIGEVENDGKKRRLPVWMLGVSAADKQTTKSQNGQVNYKEEVIQNPRIGVEVVESKASKSRARRLALSKKQADLPFNNVALEEEDSGFVVKRKMAKRKGKGEEKDVIFSGSDIEKDGVEKRKRGRCGRNVGKSSRVRRQVEKLGVECSDDIEVASPDEDAEDLTVDDLLTIAKEFVNDGVMEQEQPVDGIAMATERKSETTSLFENEPQGVPETSKLLTMPKETSSCLNPSGNLASQKNVVNTRSTGDPAQDMLNLFLGPWLTIPVQEEKKAEVITDDMVFAHKLKQQSEGIVLRDVPIPLATKKKISLKDKVAMFLD